jgi:hypothetical protein
MLTRFFQAPSARPKKRLPAPRGQGKALRFGLAESLVIARILVHLFREKDDKVNAHDNNEPNGEYTQKADVGCKQLSHKHLLDKKKQRLKIIPLQAP